MQTELIVVLAGIVILGIIVASVALGIKKTKNSEAVEDFFNGLVEELIEVAKNTIKNFDPKDYDSLEEFETVVLKDIYDNCWDYVTEAAQKAFADNIIVKAVFENIDKDKVINFIDAVVMGKVNSIADIYAYAKIEGSNIVAEDKTIEEQFSSEEYYEEVSVEDLAPAEEEVHTEEEIAALNPQKDEEEEISLEDESVEIIEEDEDVSPILKKTDKNGKVRYYEVVDGKKKQISKDYAAQYSHRIVEE